MGGLTNGHRTSELLWRHPGPASTPMWQFLQRVNKKHGLKLDGYPGLFKWSVDNVSPFWEEVWDFVGVVASKKADKVRGSCDELHPMLVLLLIDVFVS